MSSARHKSSASDCLKISAVRSFQKQFRNFGRDGISRLAPGLKIISLSVIHVQAVKKTVIPRKTPCRKSFRSACSRFHRPVLCLDCQWSLARCGWHYIFFGMYHFALILAGNIIEPAAARLTKFLHIRRTHFLWRCFQIVRTAILVCIGELFFRAHGLRAGLAMFKKIITDFSLDSQNIQSLFSLGMDKHDF